MGEHVKPVQQEPGTVTEDGAQRLTRPTTTELAATSQVLSPLRYPGSKRRQARYIAQILCTNGDAPDKLLEPFAGGASVALFLLKSNIVQEALLGEKDPLVAAFWRTVKADPDQLIERIDDLPNPKIGDWKRIRKLRPRSDASKAFKCLFLNRTSFGGVLAPRTGPIGGTSQKGPYTVDCRYAAAATKQRIKECSKLLAKSSVYEGTYRQTAAIAHARWKDEFVSYLDPPFYNKAKRLYTHSFAEDDHLALHDWLLTQSNPWILSYDEAPEVEGIYKDIEARTRTMHIRYTSASHGLRTGARELVMTNFPDLPNATEFVVYRPKKGAAR